MKDQQILIYNLQNDFQTLKSQMEKEVITIKER